MSLSRRGFLKRLGVIAVATGLATVVPGVATPAEAITPALPPAPTLPREELAPAVEVAERVAYDRIATTFGPSDPSNSSHFRWYVSSMMPGTALSMNFHIPPKVNHARQYFSDLSPARKQEVLRNSLAKMGEIGDDAFIGGTDDVQWCWEQVRSTVMKGYPQDYDGAYYLKRIIALPPVADALFLKGEPGYAEWQSVRDRMYAFSNRAAAAVVE